jgi:hypothetical protein
MLRFFKILFSGVVLIIIFIVAIDLWNDYYYDKEYKKIIRQIEKMGEIKVNDICSIIIAPTYSTKQLSLSKDRDEDIKYLTVLEELSYTLKRKPDLLPKQECYPHDIIKIILKSKDETILREFILDGIALEDTKTKAVYPFYLALRIKEWLNEIPVNSEDTIPNSKK